MIDGTIRSIPNASSLLLAQQLISKWKRNWNLPYTIKVSEVLPDSGKAMQIVIYREQSKALIRISEETWQGSTFQFETLIKHELAHLLLDPLDEEYEWQLEALPSDRRDEYSSRYRSQREKVVEHLAQCV